MVSRSRRWCLKVLPLLNVVLISSALQYDCSRTEYERCVRMADPLVKEVHFIFPDNKKDINIVCRTWNNFVDCLKKYTDRCFTDQQRFQFNKAVENPIESVHQMCMQQDYQDGRNLYLFYLFSQLTINLIYFRISSICTVHEEHCGWWSTLRTSL